MEDVNATDWISNLPPSIIESILTRLPIRDAVRTSILSRSWRYKWASITELVFDDYCVHFSSNPDLDEEKLIKFITRCLFLHQGPIHKFKLSTSCLQFSPDLDQCLLFLSRHDIKELVIDLGDAEWFRVPWSLFNCQKLTHLELSRCELDPPPTFKGFLNLKTLNLHQVMVPETDETIIERLISSSPFLESLSLSYADDLAITITAPKLKYLHLEGGFIDICLEDTPHLVAMSVAMYTGEEDMADNKGCNFINFFGGVPRLERLVGQIYFTKYLSVGYYPGVLSATYDHLKVIELYQVSFEDMKEILVVLQLITSSPNLQELTISGSSHTAAASHATDLDFWKKECPFNCTLKNLKVIKLTDLAYVPHEMEFIKFMLRNSPSLEEMQVTPSVNVKEMLIYMLTELVRFHRASARAAIIFDHNCLEK